MTNSDTPAGPAGGPVAPGLDDLPEKLRVHALAKLLGRTSREILATLAELGIPARSAQSSVDRKAAEQVAAAVVPGPGAPEPVSALEPVVPEPVAPEPDVPEPVTDQAPLSFGGIAAAPTGTADESPAGVPALAPLFAPPAPVFQPPVRRSRRRGAPADTASDAASDGASDAASDFGAAPAAEVEPGRPDAAEPEGAPTADAAPRTARRGRARRDPDPDETAADTTEESVDDDRADEQADDESGDGSGRRRRRRGRRGRGRGRGGEGDTAESADDADDADAADTDEGDTGDEADTTDQADEADTDDAETTDDADGDANRRRRRRRRRRGAGDEPGAGDENDPPNTVVRVRAPRERSDDTDGDGVQSVRGSTRLEAKRQRRRDGRDAGRRRVPILTEAEFLARREAVERSMVVRERGDRVEVGVLEDGVLVEHFVTGGLNQNDSLVGNIYLGRVQNVLPSMEAAFVDIGRGRNAVLYAGEVDWDAAGLGGRARRIEQALSSGDSVLVQVTKDPVGHKGARLTTQISLAGRFLVYVPSGGAAGISRKLPDVERKRLKDLLREIVPSEAGVIIRTASEGVTQEALERDVRRLQAQWDVVKERSEKTGPGKPKAPVLLYEEPDMLVKVVRDQFNEDFSRLVVSGDDAWETVSNYVGHVASELAERLHRHVGPRDVFEEYRIDEQLLKALDRKVWLPSGGTLVIDRTEAMTVIDVNTGKFTGSGGNLEETVTRNNLEAAEEIVRQLRLRDIGGIIVIDFIDMVLEANRDLVLRRLTECLARDRTRHQVAEVTSLGLVQMTRKRVGGGLLEHFSTPCEHCRGRGVIITTEPVTDSRGGDRNGNGGHGDRSGDRNGSGQGTAGNGGGNGNGGGESGGRRRGRGRRDEPSGDRPRRLPEAITPDRDEATTDVGAPAPVAEAPQLLEVPQLLEAVQATGVVEPATVESVRDDVEEVVVEQSLAAERGRHGVPEANGLEASGPEAGLPEAGPEASVPEAGPEASVLEASGAEVAGLPAAGPAAGLDAPETAARNGAAGPGLAGDVVSGVSGVADGSAGGAFGEAVPAPATGRPRRRGRVTRTGGAPASASGETPAVAVVTVPVVRPTEHDTPAAPGTASTPGSPPVVEPAPEAGSAQAAPVATPEPTAPARPRRARRAASRPAGPPVAEPDTGSDAGAGSGSDAEAGAGTGGDPV